jgi:hypothetical protein
MLYYVDVKVCLYVSLSNERLLFEEVWKHVWEQVPRTLGLETGKLNTGEK